ncbi:hypothetical protein EU348_14650 [Chryseobacterium indologenes]|uniref:Uncharacterized protein n=1 Tax=Chryseobacterium indologenes TaxID=253 RepID=A0A411DPU6_CHRID|nr:hypothetical protein EU348_14650 [Chryseobacterium indologenes]
MKYKLSTNFAKTQIKEIDNIEYLISSIKSINKAFFELIQSLYTGQPQLEGREIFVETLSTRILTTTNSIVGLTGGIFLESNDKIATIQIIDFPSINILTRSIIESFLTLEYLFYNKLEEDEKEFRFLLWRISGYKARQNFFSEDGKIRGGEKVKKVLDSELEEIKELLNIIEKSQHYSNLEKKHLSKLSRYGIPRLKSWSELLESSMLKTDLFLTSYKLYSNYAHSEFISLIQCNGADVFNKGSYGNSLHLKNALRLVLYINCVSIIQLKKKFDYTNEVYDAFNLEQKNIIEFWNAFTIGELT